jgi:serine/threonine protein phosphatase PrpC
MLFPSEAVLTIAGQGAAFSMKQQTKRPGTFLPISPPFVVNQEKGVSVIMDFLRTILGKEIDEKGEEQFVLSVSEERAAQAGEAIFQVGKSSSMGKGRDRNQDCFFTLESNIHHEEGLLPFGLFIVADGMGSQEKGERASFLATRTAAERMVRGIYLPLLGGEESASARRPIYEALSEAVGAANKVVHENVPEAGTTLTAIMILGNTAYIAHVGDSRAYLIKRGSVRQLTQDHSLLARLVELGQVSPEEAINHPQRSVLYRALGQAGSLEVDTYSQPLPAESRLVLCSDGLWSVVPQNEMATIATTISDPQEACAMLIRAAHEHKGEDDVTAILISMM